MYRVMIADDEPKDRNIIKILLNKKYPQQFQIVEAENGNDALEILRDEKIELLLLDLNMPGKNGFDVLSGLNYMPYVIILTAHSNFDYSQRALRLGVRDYLLKPPLREEFYRSIDQFLINIQKQETRIVQSKEIFTRDLAQQLMYYGNRRKIDGLLDVLGIQAQFAFCGMLHCDVKNSQDYSNLLDETEEELDRQKLQYAADFNDQNIAIFIFCSDSKKQLDFIEIYTQLAAHLETNLWIDVQTRIGQVAPISAYPQAFLSMIETEKTEWDQHFDKKLVNELEKYIHQNDFSAVMQTLEPILQEIGQTEHDDIVRYQLITGLTQCSRQVLLGKDLKEAYRMLSRLLSATSRESTVEITACYVHWLIEVRQPEQQHLQNNAIQSVLSFVEDDCSQPWTIESLAEKLHVNTYYLSHLFKEQTGQCFTDYLTDLRIGRAVELIQTSSMNLSQIGENVGYTDANYFSRVFKKKKGIGPRAFSKMYKQAQS